MRVSTSFPWRVENGTLALSNGYARDVEDQIAVIFTRHYERILRPFLGVKELLFDSQNTPNLIAKKLAIAIEEQIPTIARCTGEGRVNDEGTVIVVLKWVPKENLDNQQSLTIAVTA